MGGGGGDGSEIMKMFQIINGIVMRHSGLILILGVINEKPWKRSQSQWEPRARVQTEGAYHGEGSVYVTSSAICIVLARPQTGHRSEKRYDVE